ncbi:DUF2125 domain-containing protein [Telmatospirillum siberiense]|uniref:DUF2125 domain-containing protein n=1 Tax=Telmatospirillum siberiense TaxID=382514 RepID=A0A2N3Q0K1_9PROT|nr:DUF2125 domain-containing protein [Telmatospirillum siberiense]PKU26190.1 hypothetical protein CWS72_03435 [Telmatospirillum siberiense]
MSDPQRRPAASRAIRFFLIGCGLLVVLAGAYGFWWHYLTTTLQGELARWVDEQGSVGWKIRTGSVTTGGFPWRVALTVEAPAVEDPSGNQWQGPPLSVVLPLFDPRHPRIEGAGRHVLTPKGRDPIGFSADAASADLQFDDHGLVGASIRLAAVALADSRLGRLSVDVRRQASGRIEHTMTSWESHILLEDLVLPDDPRLLFGTRLPAIRLDSRLQGSVPGGSPAQALAAWRDDGGTLEIDALSVDWPPLALSGKGTLALDSDMQPMLASTCDIRGLFAAIDALVRGGVIRGQDAGMVKLAFGLLMKPGKDGEKTLSMPVTIQNRVLSIGPVKLLDLPVVTWR